MIYCIRDILSKSGKVNLIKSVTPGEDDYKIIVYFYGTRTLRVRETHTGHFQVAPPVMCACKRPCH